MVAYCDLDLWLNPKVIFIACVVCHISVNLVMFVEVRLHVLSLYSTVINSLVALVHDPEPEHPLRADLAEEFQKDRKKFMKNAEDHTKKYAEKRPSD